MRSYGRFYKPKRSDRLAPVLLLPEDETAILSAIVAAWPSAQLIDAHAPWRAQTTNRPPVCSSVLEVERTAFLWDPEIHPRLPAPRFTGYAARSPQAGRVVVWKRSLRADGVLASGLISVVVWDDMDPRMVAFISAVWREFVAHTSNYLVRWLEGTGQEQVSPGYRVGHHALAAARDGGLCLNSIDPKWRLYPPSQDKARGAVL
ncbi:hypothetical protein [Lentzea sp. NPDC051838]|uniref:hypothetical protein n=1 Tax=Lentzea sp. NPDC051838 TaxID=3154849 RepID=UPI003443FBCE